MNASPSLIVLALLSIGSVSQIYGAGQETTPPTAAPLPASERGKVDINTAEVSALEAIPEIGTNFANAVVAARPFKSVADLDRVLKIGPEKMNTLSQKVTASPVKPTGPGTPAGPGTPTSNLGTGVSKPINDGKAVDRKEVSERYDRTVEPRPAKKSEEKK